MTMMTTMLHGLSGKMARGGSSLHVCCLALVLMLSFTHASPSPRVRYAASPAKEPKVERGRFAHWGPQTFLGLMPLRSRRSEMDNRISPFAAPPPPPHSSPFQEEVSPEAAAMGESVMEEFILFLTMKDAGLLDLCMQFK